MRDNDLLIDVLQGIYDVLDKNNVSDGKILSSLEKTISIYLEIEVKKENKKTFEKLIGKGKRVISALKKNCNKVNIKYLKRYIRQCNAAGFDYKGEVKNLNKLLLSFTVTSILFIILTPQYFGPILSIMFILPIYMGLKNLKKRKRLGLTIAVGMVPIALSVGFLWLRYALYAFNNPISVVNDLAMNINGSVSLAKALIVIPSIFAVLILSSSIFSVYYAVKYKDGFI